MTAKRYPLIVALGLALANVISGATQAQDGCRGGMERLGTKPMCPPDVGKPETDREAIREELRDYREWQRSSEVNRRGLKAFDEGNFRAARAHFEEANRIYPREIYGRNIAIAVAAEAYRLNSLGVAAFDRKDFTTAKMYFEQAANIDQQYRNNIVIVRETEARLYNDQGLSAFARGDYEGAMSLFKLAESTYSLQTYRDNIAKVEAAVAARKAQQDAEGRRAQEAKGVQDSLQAYLDKLKAQGPGGANDQGLDFVNPGGRAGQPGQATGKITNAGPSDPSVVDARGQRIDLRLPVPEQVANSPALGEWRKGMDAVMAQDWELAVAWFKKGQLKDSANPALRRAVELSEWTKEFRRQERAARSAIGQIDAAFDARNRGDLARYKLILEQIRSDPSYRDPKSERWRELVFQRLDERSLAGGPKPVGQMTREERMELGLARLMGEALADDMHRLGMAALLRGGITEARVAFQAAAALAPHIEFYRRDAESLKQLR